MMQEKSMSCGPACVAMTKVYYTSSITANLEVEVRRISQNYPGAFTEIGGTSLKNLVSVLRAEGVKTYDAIHVGRIWDYLYTYAKDNTPVIVHIQWPGTVAAPGGAHVCVCIYVYKTEQKCIFLDPWYGLVELAGSQLPSYTVGDPTGTFGSVAQGTLSGWIIVTRAADQ